MNITSVRFREPKFKGAVKKIASICIDDSLILRGLKVIEKENGNYFVSFPNSKLKNNTRYYHCFPVNEETRSQICDTVLKEFLNSIN